jgi:hypothetical protein
MAISGPAPKEGAKHGRYTSPLDDARTLNTVTADATSSAPALIDFGDEPYSNETRAWYQTWCESPQAALFTVTDWQRLQMLAILVERYYRAASDTRTKLHGLTTAFAEIRQNEALLGATHVDRLKGRIKVEPSSATPNAVPAGVTALAEYRAQLASGD